MNVNGVTNTAIDTYSAYKTDNEASVSTKPAATEATEPADAEKTGVIYEPTKDSNSGQKVSKYANDELVAKLKADSEAHVAQLQNIVTQLMTKQGGAFADANDMWNFLRKGQYTVDAATKAQAQADIAEDGYWGVNQTSDRIVDFAVALAGKDPEGLEKMREAFKKGYADAEKTWGGELPEISKKTFDAVMDKFDKLINGDKEDESAKVFTE